MSDTRGGADVGSFGEEAAKLFGVLSGWAREHAGEAGDGLAGLANQAGSCANEHNDHLATGSAECTVCPICRSVGAVRHVSPDVVAHLTDAGSSLALAAAAFFAETRSHTAERDEVEHIPLEDECP